jgi:hypothetical protein
MTSTPHVTRTAAQFHEAVTDMARVADCRSAQADVRTPGLSAGQRVDRNVHERGKSDMRGVNADVMERGCPPGRLVRMVAVRLAARGVRAERDDSGDDPCWLTVAGLAGMTCSLHIQDCGYIACDYAPCRGWEADPIRLAGVVIGILARDSSERYRTAGRRGISGLSLRTIVGMELVAAGLDVDLDVYPILQDFRVDAELAVTNPGHPERGEVSIADDGSVLMECDCWEGIGTAGTEEIAESIANHVSDAIAKFNAAVYLPLVGT